MAKWKFEGLDNYVMKIEAITDETRPLFGKAIYGGAKVVADEIKDAIRSIPVDDAYYDNGSKVTATSKHTDNVREKMTYSGVKHGEMRSGIRTNERTDLVASFGIAPMRDDDGYINVKCGFDGYNRYGTPNAAIARSVESGTSFLPKFGTIGKAARKAKKKCEQEMESTLEKELQKMMN